MGARVGATVGRVVGECVGDAVGPCVGATVGAALGCVLGCAVVGLVDGKAVGVSEGPRVGAVVGDTVRLQRCPLKWPLHPATQTKPALQAQDQLPRRVPCRQRPAAWSHPCVPSLQGWREGEDVGPARVVLGGFQAPFPPVVADRLLLRALNAAIE